MSLDSLTDEEYGTKFTATKDIVLNVVVSCDEDGDDVETTELHFKCGEEVEFDILNKDENTFSIQFDDGSIAYGVPKDCFRRNQ